MPFRYGEDSHMDPGDIVKMSPFSLRTFRQDLAAPLRRGGYYIGMGQGEITEIYP